VGDNPGFSALFTLTADGSAIEDRETSWTETSSELFLFDDTYRLVFADDGAILGEIEVEISLGGGGFPIPIGLPLAIELTGFDGTAVFAYDAE